MSLLTVELVLLGTGFVTKSFQRSALKCSKCELASMVLSLHTRKGVVRHADF